MSDLYGASSGDDSAAFQAAAMKRLYRHYDRLLSIVRRNLPVWMDRFVDPEDVMQAVYVRAFASFDRFVDQGEGSEFRWLSTIAKHYVLNLIEFHRAQRRAGDAHPLSWPHSTESDAVALLYFLGRAQKSPGQIAMDREAIARVNDAMAELLPAEFQAVQLRYVQGHSVETTAAMIKRTPRAVHQLCYRGLRKLYASLRGSSFLSRT